MKYKICVLGLGYVGLPLAVEFSKKYRVIGFDINKKRIKDLNNGNDHNEELNLSKLKSLKNLTFTDDSYLIRNCNFFIITAPTPLNSKNKPDLKFLKNATRTVSKFLKRKDIVIYESTVYPGATEEICIPILTKYSGLAFNKDFFCGYSPERVNPGDKKRKISDIKKITSGSTPLTAIKIDNLYKSIIKAGTHLAPSIRVAEAAKIIENTQRDVNIALINEFSLIFNKLNIDTNAVLEAAGTKWNFLPFKPGLVGGHCIGVDPYYLAHKAKRVGHNPKIIISGRNVNDGMASKVSKFIVNAMKRKKLKINGSQILIMGFSFKENCKDIRNTKVINLVENLIKFGAKIDVYDPLVDKYDVLKEYDVNIINEPIRKKYDVIVITVAHAQFQSLTIKSLLKFCKRKNVIYDFKNILPNDHRVTKL